MAEQRNESFQNELEEQTASFMDEEFVRFEHNIERKSRAAAPAQPTNTGMFTPFTMPELRGRDNLGMFLKRFRTWAVRGFEFEAFTVFRSAAQSLVK